MPRKSRASASSTYDVDFPLFAKIDVNGANAAPLYRELTNRVPGFLGSKQVKWNFTKFLGQPRSRYDPALCPDRAG